MSNSIDEMNQFQKLTELIDSINHNNLSQYYPQSSDCLFKQYIDDLNLHFYYETEIILSEQSSRSSITQSQEKLFIILIKQISLYIKEIERLNQVILNTLKASNNTQLNQHSFLNKSDLNNSKKDIIRSIKSPTHTLEPKIQYNLLNCSYTNNNNKSIPYQSNFNDKTNKNEGNETNFSSFSSIEINNNTNNIQSKGNEHNNITSNNNQSSAFVPLKKKRTLSDNNPYPAYNKHNNPCIIKIADIKEGNKSPYMNRTNIKMNTYKIIKNVKQKLKTEEENSKMHSPSQRLIKGNVNYNILSCNRNQSNTTPNNNKHSLVNEIIIYKTQINDLTQIEEMLKEMKKLIVKRNKLQFPKLTSIDLDNNHERKNSIDTPHFRRIPSIIWADILIEGKNGQ